ncbi:4'-phosphopantetheinyl transferase [Hungatella effluvii]|uniref:4'-phosphopantetheinyl transferase n=1 Tax=Hungatella effluvii TaxID=1096246 RepID=A0A2V3XZT3_9FIRM|nr:4'-phosphopantetheinyl transferase superfamily protein [Hungatella effluvii]PXX50800.1 4'-phosphopantetheinyl transferase [Hungatella effluvii]
MVWIYRAFFEPGTGSNKREKEHEQGLLLLRRALREQYGMDYGDGRKPVLIEGAHGKPYLREYPQIQFNISHCMGLAVLGVGECSVGIDVEYVRPYREPLLKRVLSAAELRQMEAAGEAGREELFFRFWTLKESYVKAVGCGITVPLQDISFQIGDDGGITCEKTGWKFRQWILAGGYVLSACVSGEGEIRLAEQEERP